MQELPKFDFSLTKIAKKHTLAQTKSAKNYSLGQTISAKKYTLAGGISPGTLTIEEPLPPWFKHILEFTTVKSSKSFWKAPSKNLQNRPKITTNVLPYSNDFTCFCKCSLDWLQGVPVSLILGLMILRQFFWNDFVSLLNGLWNEAAIKSYVQNMELYLRGTK